MALDLITGLRDLGSRWWRCTLINDPELILSCLRQGAAEFLYLPFNKEQIQRDHGPAGEARSNRFGSTPLGWHRLLPDARQIGMREYHHRLQSGISTAGAQFSAKVLLADLDPLTGTIAFLLKLNSAYSFVHALAHSSRMDEALWNGMVTPCRGVDVLLSPEIPADLVYEPADVPAMVSYWRQLYEYSILDIPGPYSEWGLSSPELCDELLLVTTNELPAVHATQNTLARLEDQGVNKSKIKLIVNRYNTEIGLSSEAIETALDLKVFQHLPSDFESVQKALIEGKAIPADQGRPSDRRTGRKADGPDGRSEEALAVWGAVLSISEFVDRNQDGRSGRNVMGLQPRYLRAEMIVEANEHSAETCAAVRCFMRDRATRGPDHTGA